MENNFQIEDIVTMNFDSNSIYNYIIDDIIDENTVHVHELSSHWDDKEGWIKQNDNDDTYVSAYHQNVDTSYISLYDGRKNKYYL